MRALIGLMWLLHWLPLPILGRLGEALGWLLYIYMRPRRRISAAPATLSRTPSGT